MTPGPPATRRSPGSAAAPRIRRARPRDLEGVLALWLAIAEHHAGMHPLLALRAAPDAEGREMLRRLLADPSALVLVCEDAGGCRGNEARGACEGGTAAEGGGGRLLGVCVARRLEASPVARERARGEITDLGVAPALRRQGIGRALAEGALAWLREAGIAHAAVRVAHANPGAQAFWRSLGFGDFVDVLVRPL